MGVLLEVRGTHSEPNGMGLTSPALSPFSHLLGRAHIGERPSFTKIIKTRLINLNPGH
jgi:hypothetical protein